VASPVTVSRRTAIGGAAALTALVVSGCTNGRGPRSTPSAAPPGVQASGSPTPAPVDPDIALAAAVLVSEQEMLDRVLATARRHPRLAASVTGALAAHQAHVALLTRAVPDGSPTPTPAPTPPLTRAARPARVPASPRSALAALAGAEDRLSATGQRRAGVARSGAFARVLASMAAASAQQAVHLSTLSAPGTR
jgi:hypothetical protein